MAVAPSPKVQVRVMGLFSGSLAWELNATSWPASGLEGAKSNETVGRPFTVTDLLTMVTSPFRVRRMRIVRVATVENVTVAVVPLLSKPLPPVRSHATLVDDGQGSHRNTVGSPWLGGFGVIVKSPCGGTATAVAVPRHPRTRARRATTIAPPPP